MQRQKGETLIEVIIASLLFAVGILGNLQLQTVSTINNRDSLYYTQATILQDNVVSLIRSNITEARKGNFTGKDFDYFLTPPLTTINVTFDGDSYDVAVVWTESKGNVRTISNPIYVGEPKKVVVVDPIELDVNGDSDKDVVDNIGLDLDSN